MTDLLCLGEPLIEFNQQPNGQYLSCFGGDISNVAIAAARQGPKCAILSRIGADRFAKDLKDLWKSESSGYQPFLSLWMLWQDKSQVFVKIADLPTDVHTPNLSRIRQTATDGAKNQGVPE